MLVQQRKQWGDEGLGLYCAICDHLINDAPEMHEVLLTRGDMPKDLQHLIWSRYNCSLVHPQCHPSAGTEENQAKLIKSLCLLEGKQNIDTWLASLMEYVKGIQVIEARRILQGV